MRRTWILTIFFVIGLLLIGTLPAYADSSEDQVFALVNARRVQNGLPPLVISGALTNAARAYANALADGGFFSHTAPDGSTFISRDEAAGYTGWDYLEENLAGGQQTPEQVVAAWLASPEHRANLLSPNVREIGIGHVDRPGSKYLNYWVQEFGDRPGAQLVSYEVPASQGPSGQGLPAAANPAPSSWLASTGHRVSGDWLQFFRSNGGLDNLGLPLTDVIPDPANPAGQIQVFQRAVLSLGPSGSLGASVQRLLIDDLISPGADPPVSPDDAPPGPSEYFPFSPSQPTGLGHFVANYTATGQPTYFKDYFDRHGGVAVFGYPKEEPKLRDGIWTQRFQAAVFQYHPEDDRDGNLPGTLTPWRAYRVQLELIGADYLKAVGLTAG